MARKKDEVNMPLAALDMAIERQGGTRAATGMGKPSAILGAFQSGAGFQNDMGVEGQRTTGRYDMQGGGNSFRTEDMGMGGGPQGKALLDMKRQFQETKQGMGPSAGLEKMPTVVGGHMGMDQSVTGLFKQGGGNTFRTEHMDMFGGPQGKALKEAEAKRQYFQQKGQIATKPVMGPGGGVKMPSVVGEDWSVTTGPMGGALGPVRPGGENGMLIGGEAGKNPGRPKPGPTQTTDPNMPTGGAIGPATPGEGAPLPSSGAAGTPTGGAAGGKATGGGTDLDTMYKQVGDARKAALDAALLSQQQAIAAQGNALGEQYDDMRGQAYTNARISALGNNERMAATGLAGAANAGPQSGYSESSRVAQDAALGNALNAATRQEQSARDDLATQANSARLGRDQQLNSTMADLAQQKIQDKMRQDEFGATMEYNKQRDAQQQANWEKEFGFNKEQAAQAQANWDKQFGENQRQFAEQMGLSQKQFEQQKYEYETNLQRDKEARAMDNAWKSISVTGKVSAEAAKLLGIPEGTSSMEAKALAMEQAKAEVAMFGRVKTKMTAALLGVPIGTKRR